MVRWYSSGLRQMDVRRSPDVCSKMEVIDPAIPSDHDLVHRFAVIKKWKIMIQKTFMAKPGEVEQRWWLVDANEKKVGRLSSDIATILMGKHRPTYTPHVDTGDYIVVVNAEKVEFGGNKWQKKEYRWYTGYTGLKVETAEKRRDRRPSLILEEAVRRMLPKNKLGRSMLSKLKVYAGPDHPHVAQQPESKELGTRSTVGV